MTDPLNTILPQKHCRDEDDHPAHQHGQRYCPGRHTPRGFVTNQPLAGHEHPFAGIPQDEEW